MRRHCTFACDGARLAGTLDAAPALEVVAVPGEMRQQQRLEALLQSNRVHAERGLDQYA